MSAANGERLSSTFLIRTRPSVGARTTPAMDAEARWIYEESAGMCNKAVRDPPSGVRAASKVESFFCKARSYVPNVENFAAAISLLDPYARPALLPFAIFL